MLANQWTDKIAKKSTNHFEENKKGRMTGDDNEPFNQTMNERTNEQMNAQGNS